jgi:regulator of nucleoside diphosphate kinase
LRNFRIAGPQARATACALPIEERRSTARREHTVEVLALERTLTELDHVRLLNLVSRSRRDHHAAAPRTTIEELLDTCTIVPSREVAPDVATMYSQVLLRDVESGERYKLTLCYPADAEPGRGFVSVLSPVGSALLGQRVGSVVRWRTPAGDAKAAEVLALLFQPEDSGDYTL